MAHIEELKSISDDRGELTVFDSELPFDVKRTFFLHKIAPNASRGGHGHFVTKIALVCIKGSCSVRTNNGKVQKTFQLKRINDALILNPEDWHILENFSNDAIVMALASHPYDKNDYFYEEPKC